MTVTHPSMQTHQATTTAAIQRDRFPILQQRVHGKPLAYLDNAATAQKPQAVIDAISDYYRTTNANVHRGLHTLAEQATQQYEAARHKVARFLGSPDASSCVFVRGATEALNLVAHACRVPAAGNPLALKPGDKVLLSHMEHHSNIVPWQLACEATGASLDVVNVTDTGELDLDDFHAKLDDRVKIVSILWISNALGTINPIQHIIDAAHNVGALAVVDACQAAPHVKIDVQRMGCDFLAVSGHKMFGPTGIGVLYGKPALLQDMPPFQGGGEMIQRVTFQKTLYAKPPMRFEAGTPHICGAIGLGAAVDFMQSLDWADVEQYEQALLAYGTALLQQIKGLRIIGTAPRKVPVLSFVVEGMHAYDLGPVLDHEGIAIRTGHHCAEPLMDRFNVPATARASLAFYNTFEELDRLASAIEKAKKFFL